MADPLRLFILAGEPSGDRLGAHLIEGLRRRAAIELNGVGGAEMERLGLRSMFPMRELAVMGWADVIPRIPLLLWRVRQVARAILKAQPDAVVLIDAQVFTRLVATRLRHAGYRRPVLLYVAPAVWGWKSERAAEIRPLYDEVLAVLPFEPRVMAELGGPPTTYVGHPALGLFEPRLERPARGPLLLLPGSREGELRRHLPLMREIAQHCAAHAAVDGIVLPTLTSVENRVAAEVGKWGVPVTIVTGEANKRDAFRVAVAAVAVTGTVTLELAVAGVPMVTTYLGDKGQVNLWLKYKPKFASLPNALLDRPLVPEVLGVEPEPDRIASALKGILAGPAADAQLAGFAEVRELMRAGISGAPMVDPADRVLMHAARQREVIGK